MERLIGDSITGGREVLLVYSTLSPVRVEDLVEGAHVEVLGSQRFFFEELRVLHIKPKV